VEIRPIVDDKVVLGSQEKTRRDAIFLANKIG